MTNKLKSILFSKEFQKFFVVGILSFGIDFGLLNFQVYILHFQTTLLGFIFLPNIISTIISIFVNFIAQKYWTFNSKNSKNSLKEGSKFILVHLSNLLIFNTLIFGILIQMGIAIPITKILVTGLQMCYSFVLYKYFVFKHSKLDENVPV